MTTEIHFKATIEGIIVADDARPKEEAQEEMRKILEREWEPDEPERGEEVSVNVEMEYEER
jgi:hypothetical protein